MAHALDRQIPEIMASAGAAGVGILNTLQVVQSAAGIVLTVLGIVSTVIIIRKNLRRPPRETK